MARDNFMPEMNKRKPGFTYSVCKSLKKNKARIQKINETGHSSYVCRNKLGKICLEFLDSIWKLQRSAFEKLCLTNGYPHDGYPRVVASVVYKLFDKKSWDTNAYSGARFITDYQ